MVCLCLSDISWKSFHKDDVYRQRQLSDAGGTKWATLAFKQKVFALQINNLITAFFNSEGKHNEKM